jgi:Ni/Co efflux regulator RcnB
MEDDPMTRLICSILAAGSTALSLAAPASAHEVRYDGHATAPIARRVDYDRYRGEQWRELEMTRHRFYSRPHSRFERARFERWYARRCDELRYRW